MTLVPENKTIRAAARYVFELNPAEPYKSAGEAAQDIRDGIAAMVEDREIVGKGTGGWMLHRDGEGDIELWVTPDFYK